MDRKAAALGGGCRGGHHWQLPGALPGMEWEMTAGTRRVHTEAGPSRPFLGLLSMPTAVAHCLLAQGAFLGVVMGAVGKMNMDAATASA